MVSSKSPKELSNSIKSSLSRPKIKITNLPSYDTEIVGLFRQMVKQKYGIIQVEYDKRRAKWQAEQKQYERKISKLSLADE